MREKSKRTRTMLILRFYKDATRRNGKYTREEMRKRIELEDQILSVRTRIGEQRLTQPSR